MEKKKSIFKRPWFWIIVVIIIGIGVGAGGSSKDKDEDKKDPVTAEADKNKPDNKKEEIKKDEPKKEEAKEEPFEITLKAGRYTVGVDIPEGTYTLTAVSGHGNVNSSNMYSGGLNQIMASEPDEHSVAEFKNAKMESGVTLSLSGTVEVRLNSDSAKVSEMEARTNTATEEVQLGSGNYVAGTDFPVGEYDVVAVDGHGNVNTSNMFDGGLNEIFSTESDGHAISEFKNAQFEEGVELTISSCTIKLVPSK